MILPSNANLIAQYQKYVTSHSSTDNAKLNAGVTHILEIRSCPVEFYPAPLPDFENLLDYILTREY